MWNSGNTYLRTYHGVYCGIYLMPDYEGMGYVPEGKTIVHIGVHICTQTIGEIEYIPEV